MSIAGHYLYGFTDRQFQPADGWRGLAGAPVRAITHRDVSAIVSRHPVQRLMPSRSNLEPHHRIVRQISSAATLVPVAFGHISESEADLLAVLRDNHDEIREEIQRLDGKCEMGVKLSWAVDNIFLYFVRRDRELREMRDRAFRNNREPSMPEKLEIGGRFEAVVKRDRDLSANALMTALSGVASELVASPPRGDKSVCEMAILIERTAMAAFEAAVQQAAALFNQDYTIACSGPWPAYTFVRLRLQRADRPSAA
jgi:hypothetical protein